MLIADKSRYLVKVCVEKDPQELELQCLALEKMLGKVPAPKCIPLPDSYLNEHPNHSRFVLSIPSQEEKDKNTLVVLYTFVEVNLKL